jgi:hypothetical protein
MGVEWVVVSVCAVVGDKCGVVVCVVDIEDCDGVI